MPNQVLSLTALCTLKVLSPFCCPHALKWHGKHVNCPMQTATTSTSLSGAQSSWQKPGFHGRRGGEEGWMAGARRTVAALAPHPQASLPFIIQPAPLAAKPCLTPPSQAHRSWLLGSICNFTTEEPSDNWFRLSQTVSVKRAIILVCIQLQKMLVKGRQQ